MVTFEDELSHALPQSCSYLQLRQGAQPDTIELVLRLLLPDQHGHPSGREGTLRAFSIPQADAVEMLNDLSLWMK